MNFKEIAATNKAKVYFKVILSSSLIYYIFHKVDLRIVISNLELLPNYIILIIFFQLCAQLFANVLIKRTMFSLFSFKEKFWVLYKKIFKGSFYGAIMPSMIGGDAYYTYHFGKKFDSYSKILSGLFLIKAVGISVFFGFSFIVAILLKNTIKDSLNINFCELKGLFYILLSTILIITFLVYFLRKKFSSIYYKIKNKITLIKNEIIQSPRKIVFIVVYTVLFYIISIGGRVLIGKIIKIDLPTFQLAGIIMLVNFLVLIPVSIGGIGVREGSYVALMSIFGIDTTTALTMSILDFSIGLMGVFTGGAFVLIDNFVKDKKSIKVVKDA